MLKQSDVDRVFAALSDSTRRAMIEALSNGPASVSALAEPLRISLAAVVQHLQVLEDCGIVKTEKLGRVRSCRLEPAGLRVAEQWISERRLSVERRFDALEALLDEELSQPPKKRKKS
ncbi:MAG: transcriptional regulator [Archangium gephyra]|uniref:Transcriptional regulator n=1 Tax=Archangium gephyra TaxID=48 RepID=A0A2W5UIU0_9BACT|nr:MAG: transcriptional regulator [Archangium gephyra]